MSDVMLPQDFPGNCQCRCVACGNVFNGDRRQVVCRLCTIETAARALLSRDDFWHGTLPGEYDTLKEVLEICGPVQR